MAEEGGTWWSDDVERERVSLWYARARANDERESGLDCAREKVQREEKSALSKQRGQYYNTHHH